MTGREVIPDPGDYAPKEGWDSISDDGPWHDAHWTYSGRVVACPDCWEAGKVVAFGFSEMGMNRFRHNQLTLTCPECGYDSPHYAQVRNRITGEKWTQNEWVIPCHPLQHEKLAILSLVRAPTASPAGDFDDERQHCRWNDWPERQFRSGKD